MDDLTTHRLERRLAATERELAAARSALSGVLEALEGLAARSGNAALLAQVDGLRAAAWLDVSGRTRPSDYANVESLEGNSGSHSG